MKDCVIISTDGGKAYDIQHPFMIQNSEKIGVEQIYVNIIKAIYDCAQLTLFSMVET